MNRSVRIAVALFAAFCAAGPALAQKKSAGNLAAIQIECFKAQGAYLDPVTKQYMIQGTENDMLSRTTR